MRGLILGILAFFVLGARLSYSYEEASTYSSLGVFDSAELEVAQSKYFDGAVSLSFQWLKDKIQSTGAKSIEELLPHLPEALRANYTLMKSSQSLQQASSTNPRVILFAHDGSLVLTFNGNEKQTGFHSLEVMEFSSKDKKFRFFEVDFKKQGLDKFSKANPNQCMQCHTSFPKPMGFAKPIWPEYSHWMGAYGEEDDEFVSSYSRKGGEEEEGDSERQLEQLKQWKAFQEYLQISKDHPRYRFLIRRTQHSQAAPYLYNKDMTFMDKGGSWSQRKLINMPNLRLSKILDANNAARVAANIIAHPNYKNLGQHILFQHYCSRSGSYPDNSFSSVELDDFGLTLNDLTIAFSEVQRVYNNGNVEVKSSDLVVYSIFKDLAQKDPELSKFFVRYGPFDYYSSFGFNSAEKRRLKDLKFSEHPEAFQFSYLWAKIFDSVAGKAKVYPRPPLCDYLLQSMNKQASQKPQKAEPFFSIPSKIKLLLIQERSPQEVLQSCSNCHDSGYGYPVLVNAPYFPFASEENLRGYLERLRGYGVIDGFMEKMEARLVADRNYRYSHESSVLSAVYRNRQVMPLGRNRLSAKEKMSLMSYLQNLK